MGRWLGIDHGSMRIGLAVGGQEDGIATPLEVLPAEPVRKAVERIVALAKDYSVCGLVVGLPINMDDTEGPQAKLARKFADELSAAANLPVRLWDERLSSFQADCDLAGLLTRKKKRAVQDAVAAAKMLHDFLQNMGKAGPAPSK
ncbi:MAG: Holliday junction resolvase RuvX [Planctomycetes bacterium]|nr:Holliday junction resolvase RuvX [Planctomycetota bacterium]